MSFISNSRPTARPEKPITLYRGSLPAGRFGIACTTDSAVARHFAELSGPGAGVYAHRAEPRALLLHPHNDSEQHGYAEWLVDPSYLNDSNVELADRL